ncbi:CPCC family cysteine-rich protein [Ruegeria arenilitoris]|uniref:CPCC family cysteine-rich protein n=1 Tax=Ruegeria arenilitoris TaxID=1173585 RepID=UPI00147E0979|nr:CPCC family cysteine-rich protein [Ruegeria arenilitoris]
MSALRKRSKTGGRKAPQPPQFICPCCGYVTLAERGAYLICAICFWEDEDILYDKNPREPSAANHGLTLAEARENFRAIGACEAAMLPHVLPEEQRAAYLHVPLDK